VSLLKEISWMVAEWEQLSYVNAGFEKLTINIVLNYIHKQEFIFLFGTCPKLVKHMQPVL
jgi:hypothetical protein